jgi:hypothetical protein
MTPRLRRIVAVTFAAFGTSMPLTAIATPTSTSPYYTDAQNEYVQDATTERIGTVNMIMCILGALRPDALVNQGDYVALVDESKCDSRSKASASNSGGGSAGSQANYMRAIVRSTRASNSAPMITRIWFENEADGQAMDIYIHVTVTQAPTGTNPFGVFTMNYCGKDPSGGIPGCLFKGRLAATSTGLSFYEEEATGGSPNTTQLLLSNTGNVDTGSGAIRTVNQFSGTEAALFAFDTTHFLRGDGTTNYCFSRDKDDAQSSVWRYGVYDTTGARLERDSGFPVRYTDGSNVEYQGFMGYYGLFLPDAAGAANGDTIVKQAFGGGAETTYTLVKLGGRLTKFTKVTSTLAAVDSVRFTVQAWQFASSPFASFNALAGKSFAQSQADNDQIEMYWDDGAGAFKATALLSCGMGGCLTNAFSSEATVDNAVVTSGDMARGFQGFSNSLGGQVFVNLGSASPSSSTPVITREQSLVYPDEYPSSLHCIGSCLKGSLLTAGNLQTNNVYYTGNGMDFRASQVRTYVFNGDLLEDPDGGSVVSTVATNLLAGSPHQFGLRSGIMADSADVNSLADLDCNPSSPTGFYCVDRINALDDYYVWETGVNNWNQFTALQDNTNGYVRFDAPLNMRYTVPAGAAYGAYAGTNLVLQYSGFGNLWGIPGKCVSAIDNSEVNCAGGSNVRFVPLFSIPFSLSTGTVTQGASSYYVKWLDRELRLSEQALGSCSTLTLPSIGGLTLPTSGDVLDPSDPANTSVYIGAKPSVTDAPSVVHGVVQ